MKRKEKAIEYESMQHGVYPCYKNQFQINTATTGRAAAMKTIADCESFSVSVLTMAWKSGTPFDTEGWVQQAHDC